MTLRNALVFLSLILTSSLAQAGGLIIHSAELGVGKFHRLDNQKHTYAKENAWLPYVLPANVATDHTRVVDNPDGSITIYFLTLDDLLASAA